MELLCVHLLRYSCVTSPSVTDMSMMARVRECCPHIVVSGGETVQPLRMGMYTMIIGTNITSGSPPVFMMRRQSTAPRSRGNRGGGGSRDGLTTVEARQYIFWWRPWRAWVAGPSLAEPRGGLIGTPNGTARACPAARVEDNSVRWTPWVHEKRAWDTSWEVPPAQTAHSIPTARTLFLQPYAPSTAYPNHAPKLHTSNSRTQPHPYQVDVRCAAYRACCTALEVRGGEAEQPQSMGIFHVQAFAHGDGKPPHAADHCNLPTTHDPHVVLPIYMQ